MRRRAPPRHELVEQAPEREDVGAVVDVLAGDLFGGHVPGRAHDLTRGGGQHGRRLGRAAVATNHLLGELGETEVEDLGVPVRRDEDVLGLQVAMGNARAVRGRDGLGDLDGEVEAGPQLRLARLETVAKALPLQVLLHDEMDAVLMPDIEHRGDMRMTERRRRARLALEPTEAVRIVSELLGQDLDRDLPAQACVGSEIDGTHAALAELVTDFVGSETLGLHGGGESTARGTSGSNRYDSGFRDTDTPEVPMVQPLRRFAPLVVLTCVALLAGASPAASLANDPIPSPEEFFGFPMGTSEKLARWDEIIEYFELIDANSDRVEVLNLGQTTLGNDYLSIAISSPANLANAAAHAERAQRLARGHGLTEEQARELAAEGPAIAMLHHNIHSTEIGASQTSVQLVYELATGTDAETLEILDGAITVLLPSGTPTARSWWSTGTTRPWARTTKKPACPGSTTTTRATTTTATSSTARWSRPSTGSIRCSTSGSRRRTSTSTRWVARGRGCSCPPSPTRRARTSRR